MPSEPARFQVLPNIVFMKPLVAGFLPFLHAPLQLRMPADGFAEGVPMLVQDTTIPAKEVRLPSRGGQ